MDVGLPSMDERNSHSTIPYISSRSFTTNGIFYLWMAGSSMDGMQHTCILDYGGRDLRLPVCMDQAERFKKSFMSLYHGHGGSDSDERTFGRI